MFTQSKKDLAEIRHFLTTETDFCEYEPNWFISISYLQDYSRDQLLKIHKRLDDVVRDTFDPYEMNIICIGYFLEKGKKKLVPEGSQIVLNTISGKYSYDKEMTLKNGSYGTHMIMTLCPSILDAPNKRVRKLWERQYWDFGGKPPMQLLQEENRELLLAETLEFVIRDRCPSFIANGDDAIQIDRIDDHRVFKDTGEKGWKGALHYCTKQIYCKDQFLEVFDEKNSNICVA